MAGQKFLIPGAAGFPDVLAAVQASAGAADAGKIPALNASGFIDPTMMNGVGPDQLASVLASEAIAAGAIVNLYNNSSVINVRNADASAASRGKIAIGYAPAAILNAASGAVYMSGIITGLSGLTIMSAYFLGAAGALTTTVNTTAGQTNQFVGWALSATTLLFRPGIPFLN
jgi:hypothetical protein